MAERRSTTPRSGYAPPDCLWLLFDFPSQPAACYSPHRGRRTRGQPVAISTQTTAGTIPVTSEAALNAAIANINSGGGDTTIDVQGSFTLTDDVTSVTASMTITSSNGSAVNDGGHAFLTVGNSATVTLSLNAG